MSHGKGVLRAVALRSDVGHDIVPKWWNVDTACFVEGA